MTVRSIQTDEKNKMIKNINKEFKVLTYQSISDFEPYLSQ